MQKNNHPLQSKQWAEFRKKTGVRVVTTKDIQFTLHKVPYTSFYIGYAPKGSLPSKEMVEDLKKAGKENKCIFIQLEPNVVTNEDLRSKIENLGLVPSAHPLFTKYTFELDLTKSEEELLKNMHPKTRYNIRVAQKHKVVVSEDNSEKAFKSYLDLTFETTKRQKFFAHDKSYHTLMWESLRQDKPEKDKLTAHLMTAKYNSDILVAWILFVYKDTLYYPYGASSSLHRETMASNLMMWEAIRFGKKLGLKKFDMWGALGPEPDTSDSWYGFHRFKQGYGAKLVEFVGSYDLIINPFAYQIYKIADKLRWLILRIFH